MARPTLEAVRDLAGERVRLTVPKPREDQRLKGVIEADSSEVTLRVDGGKAADSERFRAVELRERERDGVIRAYRADGSLVGRVKRIERLEG